MKDEKKTELAKRAESNRKQWNELYSKYPDDTVVDAMRKEGIPLPKGIEDNN